MPKRSVVRTEADFRPSCPGGKQTLPFAPPARPVVDPRPAHHRGFTAVELMIVIAIVAILFGVAIPSLRTFIQNNRLATQANEIMADLLLARSEAMKRSGRVGICAANTASAASCTSGWSTGRLIFVDADDGKDWDSGEEVLQSREALEGGNTLKVEVAGTATGLLIYERTGTLAITTSQQARLSLCDDRGASMGRLIIIEATGRPRLESTKPSSC